MPTVFTVDGIAYRFYSSDEHEPPHVHAVQDRSQAKFWIDPLVELEKNRGFLAKELNRIEKVIIERRDELLEAWHDFFGD